MSVEALERENRRLREELATTKSELGRRIATEAVASSLRSEGVPDRAAASIARLLGDTVTFESDGAMRRGSEYVAPFVVARELLQENAAIVDNARRLAGASTPKRAPARQRGADPLEGSLDENTLLQAAVAEMTRPHHDAAARSVAALPLEPTVREQETYGLELLERHLRHAV
jgi:hypothetical protein